MAKKRALVIEDNKEIGDIYVTALEMVDFEVEYVADGKAALQRLDGNPPDVIVLDMNLPQVSGHYIYKQIRSDSRLAGTRVVIATANTLLAKALADELTPGDELLIKPVSPKALQDFAVLE